MKKLLSISSKLNSRACSLYRKILSRFYGAAPSRTRLSRKRSVSGSLYGRISPLGDPNVSVAPVLDQWIAEGNPARKWELQRIITELQNYRRFKHALEISLWMSNKRKLPLVPGDVAVRLKLIFKNFGLEQAESYFNKISENLKTSPVYIGLLNCYTMARSVDGAESVMQKIRDLGYANNPICYNLMMNLYYQLGAQRKLRDMLAEMEAKGVSHDHFTLSMCMKACAMVSNSEGMDKLVRMVDTDIRCDGNWRTAVTAAEGYLSMGLVDKALEIMNKLEGQLHSFKRKQILVVLLLRLYGEAGMKDGVYRVWNLYKQSEKSVNKVYMGVMRALMKLDDVEGMESVYEEWESSGLHYNFRVTNFLIDAYCTQGHLEKAKALMSLGMSKGGDPSVITWCHLAGGYLDKNQVVQATEALKKAILICPPRFISHKETLTACLECLENRDCLEKVVQSIKLIRRKGSMVGGDDLAAGSRMGNCCSPVKLCEMLEGNGLSLKMNGEND